MKKLLLIAILITTKVVAQIPTNGLIGHYPLDGDANDLSITGNHGVVVGAAPDTGYTGVPNTSYDFSSGHIDLNSQITLPDSNLTLTCWVKMNYEETLDTNILFSFSKNASYQEGDFDFYIQNSHYNDFPWPGSWDFFPNCKVDTKNDGVHLGTYVYYNNWDFRIQANEWRFVAIQITPDSISYSIDNQHFEKDLSYSKLLGGVNYSSGVIGKNFNGNIDEIRLYNRKLSNEELSAIRSEGTTASAINEVIGSEVSAYPNPTSRVLNVKIDKFSSLTAPSIKVVSAQGSELNSKVIADGTQSIDVSSWSKGIYYINIYDGIKQVESKAILVK